MTCINPISGTAPVQPTIMDLFRQWHVVRNQINHDNPDAATEDRLYIEMSALEKQLLPLPSVTAADLAAKYEIMTDCNGLEIGDTFQDQCLKVLQGS